MSDIEGKARGSSEGVWETTEVSNAAGPLCAAAFNSKTGRPNSEPPARSLAASLCDFRSQRHPTIRCATSRWQTCLLSFLAALDHSHTTEALG